MQTRYKGKASKAERDELEAVRRLKIKHEEAYLAQRGAELEAMYESCRVEAERRAVAAMPVEEEAEGEEEVREQGEEDEASSENDDIDIDEDCDGFAAEVLEEELKVGLILDVLALLRSRLCRLTGRRSLVPYPVTCEHFSSSPGRLYHLGSFLPSRSNGACPYDLSSSTRHRSNESRLDVRSADYLVPAPPLISQSLDA